MDSYYNFEVGIYSSYYVPPPQFNPTLKYTVTTLPHLLTVHLKTKSFILISKLHDKWATQFLWICVKLYWKVIIIRQVAIMYKCVVQCGEDMYSYTFTYNFPSW